MPGNPGYLIEVHLFLLFHVGVKTLFTPTTYSRQWRQIVRKYVIWDTPVDHGVYKGTWVAKPCL